MRSLLSSVRILNQPTSRNYTNSVVHSVGKLNHVAIAVPDLDKAISFYQNVLGADVSEKQSLPEHGVVVSFVKVGETKIELLLPLGDNSPIQNFITKNPKGGIHHICLEVDKLKITLPHLEKHNIKPLSPPKIGSHGKLVVFLHPKDCNGVLVELEEKGYPEE